jgi:hypothetical protein
LVPSSNQGSASQSVGIEAPKPGQTGPIFNRSRTAPKTPRVSLGHHSFNLIKLGRNKPKKRKQTPRPHILDLDLASFRNLLRSGCPMSLIRLQTRKCETYNIPLNYESLVKHHSSNRSHSPLNSAQSKTEWNPNRCPTYSHIPAPED